MPSSFLQVAGQQFSTELLASVTVRQALNEHWTCNVVFRSTQDERPDLESMQGQPLSIVTYDLLGTEHLLFTGVVHRVAVQYEVWGSFAGTLEAVSLCWQMSGARNYAYFLKQSPQVIAEQLASNSGLALSGTVSGSANASRVQWAETDYDFLLQLADDAESWVRPSKTGLEVQSSFQPGVSLIWRDGEYGLLEFSAGGQVHAQKVSGTHYEAGVMESRCYPGVQSGADFYGDAVPELVQAAIATGGALPADEQGSQRSITLADFDQRLQLESRRRGANAVVCRGVSRGLKVTAGDELTVVGLPSGSGTYGVLSCEHTWTGRGYENHFVATPARRWIAAVRPPRAVAGGLFSARVAVNYDPHNQGRVQINFPWLAGAPTTWARLLMPHAGADRGFLFFPEIGDEVAVRFEGGDPERPMVLGSVWNGVQKPPTQGFWQAGAVNETEFAGNYIKRIVTKSGIRITLNDTPGQESIYLATPQSNQLFMTEKANETGRPAIALHTTGDIIGHAAGRVHSKSKTISRHAGDKEAVPARVALAVASAPPAFDCKGSWAKVVAGVNKIADMPTPLARNKKISADYATIYQDDHDVKWAGLGAIVSRNAGCGMVKAQKASNDAGQKIIDENQSSPEPSFDPLQSGIAFSAHVANNALADTNQLIYRTVAPTMKFVSLYGAKQLQSCMRSGTIPTGNSLGDDVSNNKLPNNAVPTQLVPAVNQLADAENLPKDSMERKAKDQQASDTIASYEQESVVKQRIYDRSWTIGPVLEANQKLSEHQWGRDLGAVPPEVAMSADCNATQRIPFKGSIGTAADRVGYYNQISHTFDKMSPDAINDLMNQLKTEPKF